MAAHRNNWVRVSRQRPCPICGKPDNCEVSRNGEAVWCGRVDQGSMRQNAGGQFLHFLNSNNPYRVSPVTRPKAPKRHWPMFAESLTRGADGARTELACHLGVSPDALAALNVGWHAAGEYWSFPERDACGRVIGISARYRNGDKKRLSGSRAGLTYAETWNANDGPIVLVEGASDTAALVTIGVNAVGRPSNLGGVPMLVDLLADSTREIIVLGERDQKPNGQWPGKDGAIRTATRLAESLSRPVGWSLPPDHAKDVRDWLQAMPQLPADRMADLFLTGLDTMMVQPAPVFVPEINQAPPVSIEDWRVGMKLTRIQSLGHPGFYFDGSPTGAGKSHADFAAVSHALGAE